MGEQLKLTMIGLTAVLALTQAAAAGERPKVAVTCTAGAEDLQYHCTFAVTGRKSGKPLEEAQFTVGADMPSMPMAHNVKPITPVATEQAGIYEGDLHLEMRGEWALKITFSAPVRDIVIRKLEFSQEAGVPTAKK